MENVQNDHFLKFWLKIKFIPLNTLNKAIAFSAISINLNIWIQEKTLNISSTTYVHIK